MLSIGHAAFFGLGAYAVALAEEHGWPLMLTLATALAAAAVIALLIAGIGLASARASTRR